MTRLLVLLWLTLGCCFAQQFAIPITSGNAVNWSEGAGDGDGDHHDELDEGIDSGTPDGDTTYWVNDGTLGSQLTQGITSLTDPTSSINHTIRSHWRKSATGGQQIDMTMDLNESTTQKATFDEVDILGTYETSAYTLTAFEANNITDYTDLFMSCQGINVGGGSPKDPICSTQELEVPSAGGATDDTITIFIGMLLIWFGVSL